MVFFVIEIKTRAVHIAGIRVDADEAWTKQVALNLVDPVYGFLRRAKFLIHDRGPVFSKPWSSLLQTAGVTCVPIPARSPNFNPHAEPLVKTIKEECLNKFVVCGEAHLRHLVGEFVCHCNGERYHQGVGGKLVSPKVGSENDNGSVDKIKKRSRLGGLLNFYHREAA